MTEITTELGPARNVLLEEPPIGQGRDTCTSLLVDGLESPNVLFISFNRGVSDCVNQVSGSGVDEIGVITVGDGAGSIDDESVHSESVSTPSDLTGLGIEIGQFLTTWQGPTAICFDSLTSMLQYVDFQTAYEFLHAITGQTHAANARAHYHIDPSAHDEEDVAGITSLFDACVTVGEDDVSIRKRKLIA